jgi:hypothetical protein
MRQSISFLKPLLSLCEKQKGTLQILDDKRQTLELN